MSQIHMQRQSYFKGLYYPLYIFYNVVFILWPFYKTIICMILWFCGSIIRMRNKKNKVTEIINSYLYQRTKPRMRMLFYHSV